MSQEEVSTLTTKLHKVDYNMLQKVYKIGQCAKKVYIVLDGEFEIIEEKQRTVNGAETQ